MKYSKELNDKIIRYHYLTLSLNSIYGIQHPRQSLVIDKFPELYEEQMRLRNEIRAEIAKYEEENKNENTMEVN